MKLSIYARSRLAGFLGGVLVALTFVLIVVLIVKATHIGALADIEPAEEGKLILGVETGTMDYTPLRVTTMGYVKSAGRWYNSEMVEGWMPIVVDKEGRVICSPGGKP